MPKQAALLNTQIGNVMLAIGWTISLVMSEYLLKLDAVSSHIKQYNMITNSFELYTACSFVLPTSHMCTVALL
jgi:hypothetical protein